MAAIQFGLGDMMSDVFNDAFDIALPPPVVDQLNNKAHINEDEEFVFDHEGVSGRFGALDGEMEWNNGKNRATYENELENDGMTGVHKYTSGGEVDKFWQDLFGIYTWETYAEEGEISWDIDPINMQMTLGQKDSKTGTSYSGNKAAISSEAELEIKVELTEDSVTVTFSPDFETSGIDEAKINAPEMVSHVQHGDIDYSGTLSFEVPSTSKCSQYFTGDNFHAKSSCDVNIKSSDLPAEIAIRMKHKFAFVKAGSMMAYVKSENRKGDMVPFDKLMYISLYATDSVTGRPFTTIKRKFNEVGEELLLTVPLAGAFKKEIIPAAMTYGKKWSKFFNNLFANPPKSVVKAVYWMDKWVPSVQPSTFDISAIVAATRIGCGEVPNVAIQAVVKTFTESMANSMKEHEFEMLVEAREFVNDVNKAEKEATRKFALPA